MADKGYVTESVDTQLAQVRQGNDQFLKMLYEKCRGRFVSWFQKNYRLDRQAAIDLFQKAFSAFYFNVKDGKIVTLSSSIDTYLFGIGKNMMKETIRKESKMTSVDELPETAFADDSILREEEISHERSIVRNILNTLEDPCKTLLTLYYFRNFSLESIAESLGYKNEGVVKKKKCLCLKSVRALMIEHKLSRS
jgi:RNA polymerase sigma factor (sigma-70 family)